LRGFGGGTLGRMNREKRREKREERRKKKEEII